MRINSGAQVLDEQMRVRSRGDADVAVPHEPLHAVNVDAAAKKLGRSVAQVMEAHWQMQCLRPERAPARLQQRLNKGDAPSPGALSHLGIQVSSTEAVRAATDRLRTAGLAFDEEHGTDCCYALQDKVWVKDPNGNRWEVFVVKVADTQPAPTPKKSA